ncbi:GDP dissociation inhibitor, partial [Musa troglodytarum]
NIPPSSLTPTTSSSVERGFQNPASHLPPPSRQIRLDLHLSPFYGSHFSSVSVNSLASSDDHPSPLPSADNNSSSSASNDAAFDRRQHRPYSDVETAGPYPEPSRGFLFDLPGPRVFYCADAMVELLLRWGARHHVEFKSVDATLIHCEGKLCPAPDSREAIFRDRTLGLAEENQMMKFLRLIHGHIASDQSVDADEVGTIRIPTEELEMPFVVFLRSKQLPS